jgi:hypothetical protein
VQARDAADTLPEQVSALVAEVEAARARTDAAKQGAPRTGHALHTFRTLRHSSNTFPAFQLPRAALPAPTRS